MLKGFTTIGITTVVAVIIVLFGILWLSRFNNLTSPNFQSQLTSSSTPEPSSSTPKPTITDQILDVLSVLEVNRNKDSYIGKHIKARGKVFVKHYYSAAPCRTDQPTQCPPTTQNPTLSLITADLKVPPYPSSENTIDLYQSDPSGNKTYFCNYTNQEKTTVNCGKYNEGDVVTIEGTFIKDKNPAFANQDLYYLLIN